MKVAMKEAFKMKLFQKLFGGKKIVNQIAYREKSVNVLVMGKDAVGKTALIRKLIGLEAFSEDYIPTLYDDLIREVNVDEYKVSFKFMELGGTQAFPTMQEIFIQQADMYMLVYSADDAESYETLLSLREKIVSVKKKGYSELPIIVVRNKVLVNRRRSRHDKKHKKSVANWCSLNHDVSAKTGLRVNSIMENLIEESKFIGNEQDENNLHISGRYVYSERNNETSKRRNVEKSKSELYHKAPRMFNNPDNSDEKMKERRLKLQNRRNVSTSMISLKRSLSLTSLRRSVRRLRKKRGDGEGEEGEGTFSSETLNESSYSLKQSTRSLNIRSSTLPERQTLKTTKSEMNVRASTLPNANSLNTPTLDESSRSSRKSLLRSDESVEHGVNRREKSKSMYIPRNSNNLALPNTKTNNYGGSCTDINSTKSMYDPRNTNSLSVPSHKSQSKFGGSSSEVHSAASTRNISACSNKSDQINRSTASINRSSVVVHEKSSSSVVVPNKQKLRPKLSRQFSTDQGSMRDLTETVKDTPRIPKKMSHTNTVGSNALIVSNENDPARSRNSSPSVRRQRKNNVFSVNADSSDYNSRSSKPCPVKQQNSEDSSLPECKKTDSAESINGSRTDNMNRLSTFNPLNPNNIRASNSPQVLRSIPVMRRKSLSQNDITDMFTVNLPEPKQRKQSGLFKVRKTSRKSSPTNSLLESARQKSSSTERKHSGSTCSNSSFKRDSASIKSNGDSDTTSSNKRDSGKYSGDNNSDNNNKRNSGKFYKRDSGKYNRDSMNMAENIDSRSDNSDVNGYPVKQSLSRVRSKSSSEVPGLPGNEKKNGSFSSTQSYSGTSKRLSWNGRGRTSDSKTKQSSLPKGILKNSGEVTPRSSLRVPPLSKNESLSHDDISKVVMGNQDDFKQYYPNRSSVRIKSRKDDVIPAQQPKKWLQSVSFNRTINE